MLFKLPYVIWEVKNVIILMTLWLQIFQYKEKEIQSQKAKWDHWNNKMENIIFF